MMYQQMQSVSSSHWCIPKELQVSRFHHVYFFITRTNALPPRTKPFRWSCVSQEYYLEQMSLTPGLRPNALEALSPGLTAEVQPNCGGAV